jgi:hypothetical protein
MDDDWESDNFVPTLNTNVPAVREEEDLLEKEYAQPVVAKLTEEQKAKKAADEEVAFLKKIEATKLKEETAEERRRRERLQVEAADNELTNELFEGMNAPAEASPVPNTAKPAPKPAPVAVAAPAAMKPKVAGLAHVPLATNQEHFEFGNLVAIRLQDSTPFNLVAFYKGLSKSLKASGVTVEILNDITTEITKIRDSKAKVVPGKKGEPVKKTAAEKKKDAKKHEDVFGFSEKVNKYDQYDDLEDEFM